MGTLRKIGQGIKSFFKRKEVKSSFIPEPINNIEPIPQSMKRPIKRNLVAKKLKRRKWKSLKAKRRIVNRSHNINRKAA